MNNENAKMATNETISVQPVALAELVNAEGGGSRSVLSGNMDLIKGVRVKLDVVIGTTEIPVDELFKLVDGSVIKVNRDVASPVDLVLNGKVIARGSLVAVDDNFGIRVTEIAS